MYAVVATGGKQYKVAEGDVIKVEKLDGKPGEVIKLEDVLAYNDGKALKIGSDVEKQTVAAEVVAQQKGEKITIFKKKRRQNYRRTKGHRQHETVLRIASLTGEAKKAAPKKAEAKADAPKAEKKPAAKKSTAKKTEDK